MGENVKVGGVAKQSAMRNSGASLFFHFYSNLNKNHFSIGFLQFLKQILLCS